MYAKKRIQAKVEGRLRRYCPNVYKSIKYLQLKSNKYHQGFINIINVKDIDVTEIRDKEYRKIIDLYYKHHFDILGSGWRSFNCREFGENGYKHIEWNKDFRSGYVWDNENNCVSKYTPPQGADIKNVWELGRLQHLLRMALCYLEEFDEKYILEFYNLTNDFIKNNPVGVGVQWTCSMEVAIRAINLLVAYDIFVQCDRQNVFDQEYRNKLVSYIYGHGQFIFNNLEFVKGSRINHNHYYCDILGLLYIGAYLDNKKWYLFAKTEFEKETKSQFFSDGANMEGSTCYHKLCTEILQLGIAIIIHKEGKCNDEIIEVLWKATDYLQTIMRSDGEIPQIGDNDSATILKISYVGYNIYDAKHSFYGYEQMHNESRESTRNSFGILNRSLALGIVVDKNYKISNMEYSFIRSIVGGYNNDKSSKSLRHEQKNYFCEDVVSDDYSKKFEKRTKFKGMSLKKDAIGWRIFNDIGMCVYKSSNLYLCLNIGKTEDKKFMGHVHDDVLHIELYINGNVAIEDPGTLTYTANEELRNSFRNHKRHFIPIYEGKMDVTETTPFNYERKCKATIISLTECELHVVKKYDNIVHQRIIVIDDSMVEIIDKSNDKFELPKMEDWYWFSDNYGSVIEKQRGVLAEKE